MISPMKLASIKRKWQNLAAVRRKRMAVPRAADSGGCAAFSDKGCFVVYTSDEIRFVVPLDYLKNDIFQELLKMAVEEYGSQNDGPIRLPFKANFMQYTVSLIERQIGKDLEQELLTTISSWRCLSSSNVQLQIHPLFLVD
ncbi:hypothetical protein L2E82_11011 [Cichorium intybus]|uniref:Uncharacterized protein n=1 Tax=Cichorium intybus TaxID=13427 RepID=A0ACB9GC18_CICIN|nr:hypothetical protein L2E82_11011 [Cichorium intybus]